MINKKSVYIIAEAGVNHNGDLDTAIKLIHKAKESGADCVKFQTFKASDIITKNAPKANYQLKTTDTNESQFDMLKNLELSKEKFKVLNKKCDELDIDFMSTPYNIDDIELLDSIGVKIFKVASGQLTEPYFLKYLTKKNKPIILSTGMATLSEVFDSVQIIKELGVNPYVLQCTTNYPSLIEESNIKAMVSIKNSCNVEVGYSDHVINNYACFSAVSLGARIIEKHFTLDKNMNGPDHSCSLNPDEFKELVFGIRQIELSLGNGLKLPSRNEMKNIYAMRRGVVAKRDLNKGEKLEYEMLGFKRPCKGISTIEIENFIGYRLSNSINKDHYFNYQDFIYE